jgi:sulfite dehydrogenase
MASSCSSPPAAPGATPWPTPGATGTVGPNLDAAHPSDSLVAERVRDGKGVMPSFAGELDDAEIAAVAAYVSQAASG